MIRIEIDRFENNQNCTAGRLKMFEDDTEIFSCYTLENPKIGSERQKDLAIPEGVYTLDKRHSPRFSPRYDNREMYWVYNDVIPQSAYILFHGGNTEKHTEGCILLGSSHTTEGGAITGLGFGSKDTTLKFMDKLEGKSLEGATVEIKNNF